MNRDRLASIVCSIVGIKTWNRIQMRLKFYQSFSKFYKGRAKNPPARCYVYVADGRTAHGGLSDRLRGLISIYEYCKDRNIPFRISFFSPFNLNLFLVPNEYDWKLKEGEFVRNKRVGFRFFNSYSKLNEEKDIYFELLDSNKSQVHCYSNVTLDETNMNVYFNELFKPSNALQKAINDCLTLGGGRYVSVTFRFQDLLGDVKERYATELETDEEKENYISHCIEAIRMVYGDNKNSVDKVLVTADSPKFLLRAKELPYVFVIPGKVTHMDFPGDDGGIAHIKDFTDLFMISKAEHVYFYSYGRMFSSSKFAKTAALIGGKPYTAMRELNREH